MAVYLPQPPLTNAGTDVNLCEGGTATLGGTPAAGAGTTLVWSANNTSAENYLSSTTAANPTITIPAGTTGSYQYYLTVTDPNCSRRDTVLVNSYTNPIAAIDSSGPTTICSNTSLTLSVVGSYKTYAWSNSATTQSVAVNTTGNYYVVVTDNNGCTDTSNIITVTTIPALTVTAYPDTTINYGDSLQMYTDLNLATVDTFYWYPAINISCTDCPNPTVAPEADTYYGIQIYANGCPATDSALIKVLLKNNFYIPNAFTPNNDGNNDDFYILAQRGVRVLEFQIYDRIGEKIHDGLYPWDGTYKGKPCQPGTYVYIVRIGLFGEQQGIMRKGSVTLIR
jgi:gliding motility-associated-like protein